MLLLNSLRRHRLLQRLVRRHSIEFMPVPPRAKARRISRPQDRPPSTPPSTAYAKWLETAGPDVLGAPVVYTPNSKARDILDIDAANDVGYLLLGDGDPWMGIETVDLGRLPATPTRLGGVSLPVSTYGGWGRLRLSGDILYVATSNHSTHVGGLRVVDVSDVAAPKIIGSLDIRDIGNVPWEGVGLDVAGSRVYILGTTALHILDVSTPDEPVEIAALPLPDVFLGKFNDGGNVVVAGYYAYAAVSDYAGRKHGGIVIFPIAAL
jgi:hypothetical protein